LECDFDFDTVIIDEAAQAKEMTSLIPLRYGAKRLILVGDTNQLHSVVKSPVAKELGYGISIFEKLEKN
jgi:senataxin